MPIYMRFTRGNGLVIKGEATARGHEGWIEMQSVQLGSMRALPSGGNGAGHPAAAPGVSEIVATKARDCASTELFGQATYGEAAKVQIDFVKADAGRGKERRDTVYMTLTLEGVQITGFAASGGSGFPPARPMESLSLSYTKITYTVVPQPGLPMAVPAR